MYLIMVPKYALKKNSKAKRYDNFICIFLLYQQEFLNSIPLRGLPPHILRLKKGCPNYIVA